MQERRNQEAWPLLLGSGSPRRREILGFFRIPFQVVSSDFPEETIPWGGDPADYVLQLACAKANHLATAWPHHTLLCADTAVFVDGEVLNKPSSPAEAHAMLRRLSGREHQVWTGVCLRQGPKEHKAAQKTRVWVRDLSDREISLYQSGLHTLDKAGGYAVQGAGGIIIERIDGCFYNVMGLPLRATETLLTQAGIDLWQYLGS